MKIRSVSPELSSKLWENVEESLKKVLDPDLKKVNILPWPQLTFTVTFTVCQYIINNRPLYAIDVK